MASAFLAEPVADIIGVAAFLSAERCHDIFVILVGVGEVLYLEKRFFLVEEQ